MAATDWYYNHNSGQVNQEKNIVLPGMGQKPGVGWEGPFKSKDEALKFYADNRAAHPEWKEPTDSTWKQFQNSTVSGGEAVTEGAKDLFFGSDANSWFIRIGEIVLGIVLIGIGVAKLTGTTNTIAKLAKVAIP
jgi:hypothetical protein